MMDLLNKYMMEGMINVSLIELEQAGLELRGLEKNIRELGDAL